MKEYTIIELKNGDNYVLVDMLNIDNKKYFLLANIILYDNEVDNYFDIFIYKEETNSISEIEDEYEYNSIKDIFNNKLDNLRKELIEMDNNKLKIIKLKVLDINNNDYTFEKIDGSKLIVNIEIYGNLKLEVNDYLYIKEDTIKENVTIRFGSIYTDKTEIIKIVRNDEIYYLQRYYG